MVWRLLLETRKMGLLAGSLSFLIEELRDAGGDIITPEVSNVFISVRLRVYVQPFMVSS